MTAPPPLVARRGVIASAPAEVPFSANDAAEGGAAQDSSTSFRRSQVSGVVPPPIW